MKKCDNGQRGVKIKRKGVSLVVGLLCAIGIVVAIPCLGLLICTAYNKDLGYTIKHYKSVQEMQTGLKRIPLTDLTAYEMFYYFDLPSSAIVTNCKVTAWGERKGCAQPTYEIWGYCYEYKEQITEEITLFGSISFSERKYRVEKGYVGAFEIEGVACEAYLKSDRYSLTFSIGELYGICSFYKTQELEDETVLLDMTIQDLRALMQPLMKSVYTV
jgi:hypothetical protein